MISVRAVGAPRSVAAASSSLVSEKVHMVARKIAYTMASTGTPLCSCCRSDRMVTGSDHREDAVHRHTLTGEHVRSTSPSFPQSSGKCFPITLTGNPDSLMPAKLTSFNVHVAREACPLEFRADRVNHGHACHGDALAIACLDAKGIHQQKTLPGHIRVERGLAAGCCPRRHHAPRATMPLRKLPDTQILLPAGDALGGHRHDHRDR